MQVPGASEAAGHALLALAGPVGWTVTGVSLVGAAAYLRSRKAKHAETWPVSPDDAPAPPRPAVQTRPVEDGASAPATVLRRDPN